MVSDSGMAEFRSSMSDLAAMAKNELAEFFHSLNLMVPDLVRDALLEYVPLVISEYGPIGSDLAVEWFMEQRAESAARGAFNPVTSDAFAYEDDIIGQTRYLAGQLWTPEPENTLGGLSSLADKYVKQSGRDTMVLNAKREGVRWARVPSGAKTCAFCLVLASRDAVYTSKSAAKYDQSTGEKYHGYCDCQPVRLGRDDEYPDGYIPKDLYDAYDISANKTGTRNDINEIVYDIRRRFPDVLTDGVDDPEYLDRVG